MNTLAQRLIWAREQKGLTQATLAKLSGVSQGTIGNLEAGIRSSARKIVDIAAALEVEPGWLANGDGAPKQNEHGTGPAVAGRSIEEVQKLLPGAMSVRAVDSDDPALTHIPKVKLRLSAGIVGFETEPERFDGSTTAVPTDWIRRNNFNREQLIAIRVKGESMEPTLYEDDLVVVNLADTRLVDGNVYAINYEGEPVVKRLTRDAGQWWLTSDHLDQRKYYRRVCNGKDCIIVGRVVRKESERL